jgi:hypothetical protein
MAGPRSVRTHKRGPETGADAKASAQSRMWSAARRASRSQGMRHASHAWTNEPTPRGAPLPVFAALPPDGPSSRLRNWGTQNGLARHSPKGDGGADGARLDAQEAGTAATPPFFLHPLPPIYEVPPRKGRLWR